MSSARITMKLGCTARAEQHKRDKTSHLDMRCIKGGRRGGQGPRVKRTRGNKEEIRGEEGT